MITGHAKVTRPMSGPHSGHVRYGDVIIPTHLFLEFEGDDDQPNLSMSFEVRDGRPEVVEFKVKSKPRGRGIRTGDVTGYNLDEIAAAVFGDFAQHVVPSGAPGVFAAVSTADERKRWQAREAVADVIEAPRGRVSRVELERAAEVYAANIDARPILAVAATLQVSERTAARRVEHARKQGLLPETTPGRRKA